MAGRPRSRMRRNGPEDWVYAAIYPVWSSGAARLATVANRAKKTLSQLVQDQLAMQHLVVLAEPFQDRGDGWGALPATVAMKKRAQAIRDAFLGGLDREYKSEEAAWETLLQQFMLLPIDPDLKVLIGNAMDKIGREKMRNNGKPYRRNEEQTGYAYVVAEPNDWGRKEWSVDFRSSIAHRRALRIRYPGIKEDAGMIVWARTYDLLTADKAHWLNEAGRKARDLEDRFGHVRFPSRQAATQFIHDYLWTFDETFQGAALWEALENGTF